MTTITKSLLLSGLALAAAPTLAQTVPSAPATQTQVEVDVAGNVVYDSDVARSSRELAAARGLTLSDEIFTPSGSVDLELPIGRSSVFFAGSGGYDFYVNNHVLNQARINVLAGGIGQTGPCRETLSGTYARSQTDLSDLETVAVKNTEDHASVSLGFACSQPVHLAPTLQVSESWERNSAPVRQLVNDHSLVATLGLAYQRPALGTLSLFGEFLDTAFPNQVVLLGATRQTGGYQVFGGGLKFDRRLGARIQGTVSLSYSTLEPDIVGSGGFAGVTYSGDLTYRASARLNGHVEYARAITPSNIVGANFSIDDTLMGEVVYRLGVRFEITLGASRTAHHYNVSPFDQSTIPLFITDQTISAGYASVAYKMNRRLSFVLDVREERGDANIQALGYDSTRIGLTAKGIF